MRKRKKGELSSKLENWRKFGIIYEEEGEGFQWRNREEEKGGEREISFHISKD